MPSDVAAPQPRWKVLLEQLCRRCVTELSVQASVGVSTGPGQWSPGAASDAHAAQLEEYAFVVGEGPCYDALASHATVVATDLTAADAAARWPVWTQTATEAGVLAVAALPIEAGAITAGVLTLYADRRWQPTPGQFALAHRFTDVALLVLLDMAATFESQAAPVFDGDTWAELDSGDLAVLLRADVHRAAGMVMAQAGVSIDQALARLRAYAFAAERPLPEVARDVLERRLRLDAAGETAQ